MNHHSTSRSRLLPQICVCCTYSAAQVGQQQQAGTSQQPAQPPTQQEQPQQQQEHTPRGGKRGRDECFPQEDVEAEQAATATPTTSSAAHLTQQQQQHRVHLVPRHSLVGMAVSAAARPVSAAGALGWERRPASTILGHPDLRHRPATAGFADHQQSQISAAIGPAADLSMQRPTTARGRADHSRPGTAVPAADAVTAAHSRPQTAAAAAKNEQHSWPHNTAAASSRPGTAQPQEEAALTEEEDLEGIHEMRASQQVCVYVLIYMHKQTHSCLLPAPQMCAFTCLSATPCCSTYVHKHNTLAHTVGGSAAAGGGPRCCRHWQPSRSNQNSWSEWHARRISSQCRAARGLCGEQHSCHGRGCEQ